MVLQSQLFQQFVLRQAVNLVVSIVTRLIDKHKKEFDPSKAKLAIQERVKILVPESMWGEEWVESKLTGATNWMIDSMCAAVGDGAGVTEDVLTALAEQDGAKALAVIRSYFLKIIGADVLSSDPEMEASNDAFADIMIERFEYLEENEDEEEEGEVK